MIEIVNAASLATVQDLGRYGALNLGVGVSGAMDPMSLAAGNILLGNEENAAGIEIPVFPFSVKFHTAVNFTITGADAPANLNGFALLPWWLHRAEAGQTLTLTLPQSRRWRASRAITAHWPGSGRSPCAKASRRRRWPHGRKRWR